MRGQHKFYYWSITVYTGPSLVILSYDIKICGGTLIIIIKKGQTKIKKKLVFKKVNLHYFGAL